MNHSASPQPDIQSFQPDRFRLGSQIACYLRDLIMSGHFVPGEHLRLATLSTMFDVSTTPVREALVLLEIEGLVKSQPHRGFVVEQLSRQEVRDLFHLHAFIAGQLAERAATSISSMEFNELFRINEELHGAIAANHHDNVEQLNHAFHRLINRTGDSSLLSRFLTQTTHYVPRKFYAEIEGWTKAAAEGHGAILEALRMKDGVGARILTEDHIRLGGDLLVVHLEARGFWRNEGSLAVAAG